MCLFYFNLTKIFVIDFCFNLPNDGKQKQENATEVYLLWIFGEKKHQAIGDQYRKETVKQIC